MDRLDAGPRRAQIVGVSDDGKIFLTLPPLPAGAIGYRVSGTCVPSFVLLDTGDIVADPDVLVGKPGPAVPIHGPVGPFPFAAETAAFARRADDAIQAAGLDTDEYVDIDGPGGEACLDGRFTAAELRTIAEVMDALAKETR